MLSRLALGSIQPPVSWVPEGLKWQRREADHYQVVPESRKRRFIHADPHIPFIFIASCLVKHGDKFTFTRYVSQATINIVCNSVT
jgi:hypothetical protein